MIKEIKICLLLFVSISTLSLLWVPLQVCSSFRSSFCSLLVHINVDVCVCFAFFPSHYLICWNTLLLHHTYKHICGDTFAFLHSSFEMHAKLPICVSSVEFANTFVDMIYVWIEPNCHSSISGPSSPIVTDIWCDQSMF